MRLKRIVQTAAGLLLLATASPAETLRQLTVTTLRATTAAISTATIGNLTITNITSATFSGPISATSLSAPSIISSTTVKGAGGLGVVYGITAATASIGYLAVGTLTIPTTVALDVAGLIRTSSGIVTLGGNARGQYATDLQVFRTGTSQVALGANSVIGGGGANYNAGSYGTIAGGSASTITVNGDYGTIGGGRGHRINAVSDATIAGGNGNVIAIQADGGFIGGGNGNTIGYDGGGPGGIGGVVGGGTGNQAYNGAFVGGGNSNLANYYGSIAGGDDNYALYYAAVGGGVTNSCNGQYGICPGGRDNTVSGNYGFATGRRCKSTAAGAFCLSDSTDADATNAAADSWRSRFSGGYYFTGGVSTVTAIVIATTASPASNAACVAGTVTWDASYLYLCTATAVWKRVAVTGGY